MLDYLQRISLFFNRKHGSVDVGYATKDLDLFICHFQGTRKTFILTGGLLDCSATPASRSSSRSTWPGSTAFPLPETLPV